MKNTIYFMLVLILVGCKRSSFDYAQTVMDLELPSMAYSKLTVSHPNYADGITPAHIHVMLKNGMGQPLKRKPVTLEVSGEQNNLIPCPDTNDNGETDCRLYSTKAELKTVRTVGATVLQNNVTFDPLPFNPSSAALVPAGNHTHLVSGHKITAVFGDWSAGFRFVDSMNVRRMNSTILAVMPE